MKKLVCMDGNSLLFRAFFALPPLTNQQGIHTNAVYGFTMMLLKILGEEQPTHVVVAFDKGKMTFRHETYADYKGKRDKTPSELSEQIPYLQQVLDAFQIRYVEKEQYEADDIIGTYVKVAEEQQLPSVVISGDKDLLQLVSPLTQVLLTKRGVTEVERYDEQMIAQRYGLRPHQIIDLKGLMGDNSDQIPGIQGVGEKTALKLLALYPSVEEVIAHADDLPGKKLRERVVEHQDLARLSKQLATIHREVPLPLSVEQLERTAPDYNQLRSIFQQLGFKTLWEKISPKEVTEPAEEMKEISYSIVTENDNAFCEQLSDGKRWACHVELTAENPHHADIVGLSLSDGQQQVYFDWETVLASASVRRWLADEQAPKVLFDSKRVSIALQKAGLPFAGVVEDLLLAAYLLNPTESGQALSDIVARYLEGVQLPNDESVYGKGAKRKQLEGEALASHLAHKTHIQLALIDQLKLQLEEKNLFSLYQMELRLASLLTEMECTGVKVDGEALDRLGTQLKETIDQLQDDIIKIAGTEFNLNSPKQLGEILFDKLGLPVIKRTKTGYSTSADVLEKLAPQHEIVDKILHYRQVGKLYSTYIEGLRKEITNEGKIHTQFHQTIAATGRLSSSEPNLQNIPIRLEEGRRIRQVFIPAIEGNRILSADYSQVELRVLAHLSQDSGLVEAFRENRDIHTQTAMDIFSVDEQEVTSLMRRQAKAVNFGIVYGISDYGLSQNLNITRQEAKQIIEQYFQTYPGVEGFMNRTVEQARESGYVTTLLGRRRYLPDITSRNFNLRSFAERTAMNTPIQGTAADLIKVAMLAVDEQLKADKLKSQMLLQVHDELIFEVPVEEIEQMKALLHEKMESPLSEADFSIPLHVDIHEGANWYEAK